MTMLHRMPPLPRLVAALYVIDVAFLLAFVAQLTLGSSEGLLARQLHPGREANLPTWYSSSQWLLAAGAFAIYARFSPPGMRGGIRLLLPPLAALSLSLDEAAALHEWIGGRSDALLPGGTREGTFFSGTGIWMLILVPLALGAALWIVILLGEHLRAAPAAALLIVGGGVLFLLGAGGIEAASNLAAGDRPMQLGIQVLEEFVEMVGATTVVWGSVQLLRTNGIRIGRCELPLQG
jgi:hypothetical protein